MKKGMTFFATILVSSLCFCPVVLAEDISNEQIVKEIKALKARISKLEQELTRKDREIEALKAKVEKPTEAALSEEGREKWTDRIELSGVVEVGYASEKQKVKDPATGRSTSTQDDDITLSKAELHTDAKINKYTRAHMVFLYEEDEDADRVRIDEGTIRLGGIEETHNLYFVAGKYYPHFGELNSWFISAAVEAGYNGQWFSAGAGAFHGDIQKAVDVEKRIKGFFADANIHNPENTLGGLSLLGGASYLNNVADTDTLQDQVNQIRDYVGGIALYMVAGYRNFRFGAEYISALDDFHAGEMVYAIDRNSNPATSKPAAWNLELAFRLFDPLQLAVRYEGTGDMFGLYPAKQYGLAVSYDIFKSTTLSAEYLHGDYDDNNQNSAGNTEDSRDAVTLQLAIEF